MLDEKQPAATAEKRNPPRDIRIVLAVKVAVLASLDPMIPFSTGAPLALSCHKRLRLPRFQGRDEPEMLMERAWIPGGVHAKSVSKAAAEVP